MRSCYVNNTQQEFCVTTKSVTAVCVLAFVFRIVTTSVAPKPPLRISRMSKRKLRPDDGASVIAARLRRDLTAAFDIPCVPMDAPEAEQPEGFVGPPLYRYQKRSLARMLAIERGTSITVRVSPVTSKAFAPRGGVVADTVGMGKTAQLIALMLASPGQSATLVVTPEHLCHQWRAEIAKFAGDALRTRVVTNESELAATLGLSAPDEHRAPGAVVIVSLEYLCGQRHDDGDDRAGGGGATATTGGAAAGGSVSGGSGEARAPREPLPLGGPLHRVRWERLVLDECHDAVLLNGHSTERLRAIRARKCWCVSGTPFPEGDRSAFGIHQLLEVSVM